MVGVTFSSFTRTDPQWCAQFLAPECLLPAGTQADITEFGASDAQTVEVAAGVVAAGSDVTLQLARALNAPIRARQSLDFGAGEIFTLTTRAEQGATTITGDLADALEGGETAEYAGVSPMIVVPDGIFLGRTFAERAAGEKFGKAELLTDDEIYLVAFANNDVLADAGVTFVRHRHLIYENKLPGWSDMSAGEQAKIRTLYDCVTLPENA